MQKQAPKLKTTTRTPVAPRVNTTLRTPISPQFGGLIKTPIAPRIGTTQTTPVQQKGPKIDASAIQPSAGEKVKPNGFKSKQFAKSNTPFLYHGSIGPTMSAGTVIRPGKGAGTVGMEPQAFATSDLAIAEYYAQPSTARSVNSTAKAFTGGNQAIASLTGWQQSSLFNPVYKVVPVGKATARTDIGPNIHSSPKGFKVTGIEKLVPNEEAKPAPKRRSGI